MTHDKASEAAAVDQAIADVRVLGARMHFLKPHGQTGHEDDCVGCRFDAALRVLADAVEELRDERRVACEWAAELAGAKRAAEAERDRHIRMMIRMRSEACYIAFDERDRLARQVADLEAALREYDDIWDDMLRGVSITHVANRIHRARAALAAGRSRDPQEPTHDPSATPFSRPALQSNEAGLFGHDHVPGDPQEGA